MSTSNLKYTRLYLYLKTYLKKKTINKQLNIYFTVSNEVPEHPVISPVSGSIFEKRLIEKYITENGVDPINGKELTLEQLIEIKSKIYYLFYKKNPAINLIF